MSKRYRLQRWINLKGPNSGTVVTQEFPGWQDTQGFRTAVVSARVLNKTNCDIKLQTAISEEIEAWTLAYDVPSTGGVAYLQAETGATNPLEKWLRWEVESTAATWEACFAVDVELKS